MSFFLRYLRFNPWTQVDILEAQPERIPSVADFKFALKDLEHFCVPHGLLYPLSGEISFSLDAPFDCEDWR